MKTNLEIEVNGQKYPVYVSDSDGTFRAEISPSETIRASTYDELVKQGRKVKQKFRLPFTQVSTAGVRSGEVTGIHAVNGNLLVKWDSGQTEQLHGWSSETSGTMPRLSDEEARQAALLVGARNDATAALEEFIDARKFASFKKAALAARDEAAGKS